MRKEKVNKIEPSRVSEKALPEWGGISQSYNKEDFDSFVRFAVPLYATTVFTIANASLQSFQSSEVCL